MPTRATLAILTALTFPTTGCITRALCTPGASFPCECFGVQRGTQVCSEDGRFFFECRCGADDGGVAAGDAVTTIAADASAGDAPLVHPDAPSDAPEAAPDSASVGTPIYGRCGSSADCAADTRCVSPDLGGRTACANACVSRSQCPPAPPGITATPDCAATGCFLLCRPNLQTCPAGMACVPFTMDSNAGYCG